MGLGNGHRVWLAALVGVSLAASTAAASDPRATERFRAAAALEERALYDLAAAEYAALLTDFAADPLAEQARLERGVCLFQLGRYAEARSELRQSSPTPATFNPTQTEKLLAYLGLAEYNLARDATGPERDELLDAALTTLGQHREHFPQGALAERTAFYQAEALYARRQLDVAAQAYRALVDQHPDHPHRADALYALGVVELELGHCEQAAQTLERFGREFPGHPSAAEARRRGGDARLTAAIDQLDNNTTSEGVDALDRLLTEFPESPLVPSALVAKAKAEFALSDLPAAEATLSQCLDHFPQHEMAIEARALRIRVRFESGDFAGSLADANAALDAGAPRSGLLHLRGLCEQQLGKPVDTVRTLQEIVTSDPQYPALDRVLYDLAWAHQAANEPQRATDTFARLAESHPDSPLAAESRYRVGEAHYLVGEIAAAAKDFRAAADTANDFIVREQAIHKLAWCEFDSGDYAIAEQSFRRQIAECPDGQLLADAKIMTAECQFQQRKYVDALAGFTAALDRSSPNELLRPMATVHAAQAAAIQSQWPRALELSDRALQEYPISQWTADARTERATALFHLGRLDEAQRDFSAIVAGERGEHMVRAEFMLGQIRHNRKEFDDAVRLYFKAAYGHGGRDAPAAYHPWQAEAIYAAARALEATGRPDSARMLDQELVDQYPDSPRATLARQSLDSVRQR